MKKLILAIAMILLTASVSAKSVRYFTRPQALRVATTLDAQSELMIYCGYEYELATYVIINEVWMEPVNSKYYEIWLYGYDAYTGEEIYMPIDLSCIWLYNSYGNRIYSAAQYLRFRSTVSTPNFYWTMPPYNSFVRRYHDPHYNHLYTYHYEVHRYGWRPPTVGYGAPAPLPPYYMRTPATPAHVPNRPFTPGVDYPKTSDGYGYLGGGRNTTGTRNTGVNNSNGGARSGDNHSNIGNPGTTNRNSSSTNTSSSSRSNTATTSSRNSETHTGSTNTRNTGTATPTTGSRGTTTGTSTNTSSRSSATTPTSSTSRSNTATESSRSTTTESRSSGTTTGTRSGTTTTRNSGTTTSSSRSGSTSTTTRSSSTTTRSSSTSTRSSSTSTSTSRSNTSSSSRGTNTTTHTGSRTTR